MSKNSQPVTLTSDVPYGMAGGAPLLLDILWPASLPRTPMPAVIEIHGGGWAEGEKDALRNRFLAERGYFTVSISYRLSSEAIFPAQAHDAKAAVRWLRAHASEYGVDPDRVGVWGHSAGGHLAALLGTSADVVELEGDSGWAGCSSRVQAVVDICGPTDTLDPAWEEVLDAHGFLEQFFGGPASERPDLAHAANPITHVRSDAPPFMILHGEQDELVPFGQSRLLHEALRAEGVDSRLVPVKGGDHGLDGHWEELERLMLDFFDEHLRG